MGQNFNKKFDGVVWEHNEEHIQAWKDGRTGYPIVDAGMRAMKAQGPSRCISRFAGKALLSSLDDFAGYMANRCRMIVAMFLSKDLMHDWRIGEKYFSENLVDCDLGAK